VRIADGIARVARRTSLGDLSQYGLPIPDEGVFSRDRRLGQSPTLVDIDVIDAVKNGSIEVVPAVDSFDTDKVVLADGTRLDPDVVIAATGYRRDLTSMVGHLKVLDSDGKPLGIDETPVADGLRFFGYLSRPGLIGHFASQSRSVAKTIAAELVSSR
jgi:cation diffusion facilitator CzcD-associated flavoprotein CzcO